MDWIAVVSGFGVGVIVGLTGVGAGSLMTPLLLSVFKLNPAVAIGTDPWFAGLTKVSGSVAHHRQSNVDYRITGLLLAGSVPAVMIGLMHYTGVTKGWASALTFPLGVALLLTAIIVAYRRAWHRVALKLQRWLPEHRKPALAVTAGAASVTAGLKVIH